MLTPLLLFLYTCPLLSFFPPCLLPFFFICLLLASLLFSFLPFSPFPFSCPCPVLWSLPCPSRFPFHFYCCFHFLSAISLCFLAFCLPSLFKQRRNYLCDLARFMSSETVCWGQPRSLFQWEQTPIPPCGIVSDKELLEYFRLCRFAP